MVTACLGLMLSMQSAPDALAVISHEPLPPDVVESCKGYDFAKAVQLLEGQGFFRLDLGSRRWAMVHPDSVHWAHIRLQTDLCDKLLTLTPGEGGHSVVKLSDLGQAGDLVREMVAQTLPADRDALRASDWSFAITTEIALNHLYKGGRGVVHIGSAGRVPMEKYRSAIATPNGTPKEGVLAPGAVWPPRVDRISVSSWPGHGLLHSISFRTDAMQAADEETKRLMDQLKTAYAKLTPLLGPPDYDGIMQAAREASATLSSLPEEARREAVMQMRQHAPDVDFTDPAAVWKFMQECQITSAAPRLSIAVSLQVEGREPINATFHLALGG